MKKGTNSLIMRLKNEKAILSMVYRRPTSRVDISEKIGLTKAAVSIIADELIEKGLLAEHEAVDFSGVGRRPLILSFKGDSIYTVGINITRKNFTVGICNFSGEVIDEEEFLYSSPEDFFGSIGEITYRLLDKNKISVESVTGIGVVTPGPVDTENEIILNPPNFDGWFGIAISERLREIFDFNIYFTSVSRGVAVAERYFGAAKDSDSFAALLVNRDGIGSALVLGGKLFRGNNEIGHTTIAWDGIKCECGNRGCLEKYASLSSVMRGTPFTDWRQVIDGGHRDIIEKEAAYLGAAIVNVANGFDIDRVVLCGEAAYGKDTLTEAIKQEISGKALLSDKLTISSGTDFSPSLIGAAVAVHNFFT